MLKPMYLKSVVAVLSLCAISLAALPIPDPNFIPAGENGNIAIFESYFPDDAEAGKRLDEYWETKDRTPNVGAILSDKALFELFRKGLRRCMIEYKDNFPMQYIGTKYIWYKKPSDPNAVDLLYFASFSPEFKYYAIYSGLSVANPKPPKVLARLVDIAIEYHQIGRIIWGVRESNQEAEFMTLLTPYLADPNTEKREHAEIVVKAFNGEIDANKWENEWNQKQRIERTKQKFGGDLPQIKTAFLTGTSKERLDAIRFVKRNAITLTFDNSFIEAIDACAHDSNARVRADAAAILGSNFICVESVPSPEATEIMMRLSTDEDPKVRYNAVYFGLSVVTDKNELVVRRLVDLALSDNPTDRNNDVGGMASWGLRRTEKARPLLLEYLSDGKHDSDRVALLYESIFNEKPPRNQQPVSDSNSLPAGQGK